MMTFQPGSLWRRIEQTTARALEVGALQSIPTDFEIVEDQGMHFLVRIVANLARKHDTPDGKPPREGPRPNPFLPYDQDLYVADASPSHVCVLNKFNVVDHHLLVITREFERQEAPLTEDDFRAFWRCLPEYESLGFYNGGTIAGASQPHKHLQLTPLPILPGGFASPIDPLIDAEEIASPFGQCSRLPFRHAIAVFGPSLGDTADAAAAHSLDLYEGMMQAVGRGLPTDESEPVTGPYNLLITRRWMMVVPRCEECFEGISLNSLAFAGALLVRDQNQRDRLKAAGPMAALCHTAGRRR